MSLTKYLTPLVALLVVVAAVPSSPNLNHVFKRSPLLENRQTCQNPSWIPACPVGIPCVPPGAICCDDGVSYAIPPGTCPEGTLPIATASTQGPEPTITPAPTSTPIVELTLFTTEYTWYYYFYYFTFIEFSETLTSYQITTVTTLSVSATDSVAAAASFGALSATLVLPTPTQTATEVSGSPSASTLPTTTPSYAIPTATGTGTIPTGTGSGVPAPTFTQVPVGAAGSLRAGNGLEMALLGVFALIPAVLMVQL